MYDECRYPVGTCFLYYNRYYKIIDTVSERFTPYYVTEVTYSDGSPLNERWKRYFLASHVDQNVSGFFRILETSSSITIDT